MESVTISMKKCPIALFPGGKFWQFIVKIRGGRSCAPSVFSVVLMGSVLQCGN